MHFSSTASPSLGEVVDQCTEMFVRFHECLVVIERDSVCRCGAWSLAPLGVKFIIHFGEIQEISVAGFTKATGREMIVAHKLLKNDIPVREHILVTEAGTEVLGTPGESGRLRWEKESSEKGVGEVRYDFASRF